MTSAIKYFGVGMWKSTGRPMIINSFGSLTEVACRSICREYEDQCEYFEFTGEVVEAETLEEAAERLAEARVKVSADELQRYIEKCKEISNSGEYSWWSRLAEILSALADEMADKYPDDSNNGPGATSGKILSD